ncbi:MAG: phospholipid carrier-dependent glycosyltransferase [Caldiserica bacterium]|nr:phospholipid carrier-dependent glycosyltransferase [Caldisericota bacterium]
MRRRGRVWLFLLFLVFVFLSRGLFLAVPADKVFDEVHYVRAASFYLAGQEDPNWEHPPLGKMFIALGMQIFGDNPIGWRIFPYILGCLSAVLIFFTARALGLGFTGSLLAGFLCSFDFLSFIQGRLAMLDIFVAFFILLAFWGAARFFRNRSPTYFFLTLISLGLALSSKWSALYPAFFLGLAFLFQRPFYADRKGFKFFLLNGLIVFLCSLIIIGGIYLLSYAYYFSFGHSLADFLKLHKDAFAWHTRPNIEHPYASQWWTWPLMLKGVWYYYKTTPEGLTEGILAIGNPLVWYLGGVALILFLLSIPFWARKSYRLVPAFNLLGYGSNFLPWIVSSKGGFIFYMLPTIPFYSLALAFLLERIWKSPVGRKVAWTIMIITFLAFVLFYPLLTGLPVYQENFLRDLWTGSFFKF